jgi:hypothetical protein
VSLSEQVVAKCDYEGCDGSTSYEGALSTTGEALSWLDSVGWVQFRSKQQNVVVATFTFCPTHLADLRHFFGNAIDASVGLHLSIAKVDPT